MNRRTQKKALLLAAAAKQIHLKIHQKMRFSPSTWVIVLLQSIGFSPGKNGHLPKKMSGVRKNRPILWRLPSGLFSISLKCTFLWAGPGPEWWIGKVQQNNYLRHPVNDSVEQIENIGQKFCWVHHYHRHIKNHWVELRWAWCNARTL